MSMVWYTESWYCYSQTVSSGSPVPQRRATVPPLAINHTDEVKFAQRAEFSQTLYDVTR